MRQLTVGQRIVAAFTLVLLSVIVMRTIELIGLRHINLEVGRLQTDSLPGSFQSAQLLNDLETRYSLAERLLVQPGIAAALAPQFAAIETDEQHNSVLYAAGLVGEEERETWQRFLATRERYLAAEAPIRRMRDDSAARVAFGNSLASAFAAVRASLGVLVALNDRNANESTARIGRTIDSATRGMFFSFLATLLIALACGYLLHRDITSTLRRVAGIADQIAGGDLGVAFATRRPGDIGRLLAAFDRMVASLRGAAGSAESIASGNLTVAIEPQSSRDVMGNALANMVRSLSALVGEVQKSGIAVNSSLTEIAATAKEQQATANSTAATVTEIGATSNQISATSRELVETMRQVAFVAEETATLAGGGQASLVHMVETMHNVMSAGESINDKLTILSEKAANITQVVTTITKVADQTNLLSLNAAIEAEKAGDAGRGFSVVALEIRRLADQTAVATFDIEQMVKEILSALSAGVVGMEKFSSAVRTGMHEVELIGAQFNEIIDRVQALVPRVESAKEGMHAQAAGAEEITQALRHLTEASQQTVEALQLSTQAVEDLRRVSSDLRAGVSSFKVAA